LRKTLTILALALATATAAFAIPALAASKATTVKVADNKFVKNKITVKAGSKVTWKWTGAAEHNVTVDSGPTKFHSKTQASGTFAQTLKKPGTYKIECTIHKALGMTMTIKVTK
jgi:plastocyanin